MTSVVDLAILSEAVYEDKVSVGMWLRSGLPHRIDGSGFKSALYQHRATGEYAMAIAGTEPTDKDDLKSDLQIARGNVPDQHRIARDAYQTARGFVGLRLAAIYLTGHSLGGGLASMLAKEYGQPCVTFNAPGMARSFAALKTIEPGVSAVKDENRKVWHIRAHFDAVSIGTGKHMGKNAVKNVNTKALGRKEVAVGVAATILVGPAAGAHVAGGMAVAKAHGISRLIPVLKNNPEYTKDLGWL